MNQLPVILREAVYVGAPSPTPVPETVVKVPPNVLVMLGANLTITVQEPRCLRSAPVHRQRVRGRGASAVVGVALVGRTQCSWPRSRERQYALPGGNRPRAGFPAAGAHFHVARHGGARAIGHSEIHCHLLKVSGRQGIGAGDGGGRPQERRSRGLCETRRQIAIVLGPRSFYRAGSGSLLHHNGATADRADTPRR
jgi:hypothetical protein